MYLRKRTPEARQKSLQARIKVKKERNNVKKSWCEEREKKLEQDIQ